MYKKQIRFYFWIIQGYIKKHFIHGIIGLTIIAVAAGILSFTLPSLAFSQDTEFVEGIVGKYTLKQLPQPVLEYISYGLVRADEKDNPVPHAAESIEADPSGKKFTIKLNPNVKWHNGAPLSSADLAYSLADVNVEKPDAQTIIFNLKDSYAPFPTLLTSPLLKITANDEILGVGDYYISKAEYRQSQSLTSLTLESKVKKPSKIHIKFYPTEEEAVTALKLGQIHGVRIAHKDLLTHWNNAIIYEKIIPRRFVGTFFNLKDPLVGGKDSTLRQALALAIPEIPGYQPFLGPFPTNSWAYTPLENKYRNDPARARTQIDKYKQATKNGPPLEITLTTLPIYKSTAEFVKVSWENLGIKVNLDIQEKIPQQFQTLLIAQELPTDPDQYSLWHSTQTNSNITQYNNLRVDKNLEDARKTIDQTVRKEKYADFQKQLIEDVPVIYHYQPYNSYILIKKYATEDILKLKGFK